MRNGVLLACLWTVVSVAGAVELPKDRAKEQAKTAVHALHTMMKSNVKKRLKEGGVLSAAKFCGEESYGMIRALSEELGPELSIKRVSLLNRNPKSFPNENERGIVRAFDLMEQGDAYLPDAIVQLVDASTYKVYIPSTMSSRNCKKCHGSEKEIDPQVREYLNTRFPDDKAVGFRSGQVRGAVVVTVDLGKKPAPSQGKDTK